MSPHDSDTHGLRAQFQLRRGALELDVHFHALPGETVVLVGPNGAGKSSVLRTLAGLLRLDRGNLLQDGATLDSGIGGLFVPAAARRFGVMLQGLALFPHLTVLENVAYGPRSRWPAKRDPRDEALDALVRVGLDVDHARRLPNALSGGEAQRVALARALAGAPRALLLDEPLSAVDASTRRELRPGLRRLLDAFEGPRVLVVHDAQDALLFGDRMVVLEQGRVVQTGTAAELAQAPASTYVADLLGVNVLTAEADGAAARVGTTTVQLASAHTGPVRLTIHPRAISLFRERPDGSPRNAFKLSVGSVEEGLDRARVLLTGDIDLVAEVTRGAVSELDLCAGRTFWATVKATDVHVAAE